MPISNSVSNIIGVKIPYWLWQQFKTRSDRGSSPYRDDETIKFISNKTAWVRMVSSVNLNEGDDRKYFQTINDQIGEDAAGLAKQYVLFGGTSRYLNQSYGLRSGFSGMDGNASSGGAYGIMGADEIQKYGYRPMPGIVNVSIETQGRLGSVRAATVNFKCWDRDQLDIMDALYFKLGYTMFLEWGQTVYFSSPNPDDKTNANSQDSNVLKSTELVSIDPFDQKYVDNKELVYRQIAKNSRDTEGNYDAMLGMVTNFTFSFNQEGGYDCTVKLISLGVLGDSIKVNNSSKLVNLGLQKIKDYEAALKRLGELAEAAAAGPPVAEPEPLSVTRVALETNTNNISVFSGFKGDTNTVVSPSGNSYMYLKGQDRFFPLSSTLYSNLYVKLDKDRLKNLLEAKSQGVQSVIDQAIISTSDWNKDGSTSFTQTGAPRLLSSNSPRLVWIDNRTEQVLNRNQESFYFWSLSLKYLQKENPLDLSISYIRNSKEFNEESLQDPEFKSQVKRRLLEQLSRTPRVLADQDLLFSGDIGESVNVVDSERRPLGPVKTKIKVTGVEKRGENEIYLKRPSFSLTSYYYQFALREINSAIVKQLSSGDEEYQVTLAGAASGLSSVSDPASTFPKKFAFAVTGSVKVSLPYEIEVQNLIENRAGNYYRLEDQKIEVDLLVDVPFTFATTEFDLIKSFRVEGTGEQLRNTGANPNEPIEEPATPGSEAYSQISKAFSYMSNLELSLRIIQLDSLTQALNPEGRTFEVRQGEEGSQPTLELTAPFWSTMVKIYDTVFSNGVLQSPLIDNLIYSGEKAPGNKSTEAIPDRLNEDQGETFKTYAKYGFATKLLSGEVVADSSGKIPMKPVDYKKLLSTLVLPYKVNQDVGLGTSLVHPVYVQFGLFLMLLNHSCTVYNPKAKYPSPIVYVDFNPNHNFCLTSPLHLSTDPFTAMIPYGGGSEFRNLFDQSVLNSSKTKIKPVSGSNAYTDLFLQDSSDRISSDINKYSPFLDGTDDQGRSRGRIMNVLISVEYLLGVIKQFAKKDGENKVFLKPLIEQVLMDVNKALGNFNIFRLSYNDAGNVFQIVDDQIVPSPDNNQLYGKNDVESQFTKLPLFGKNSIATNLEIKTEVSTKLANMLAISANAPDKQGSNSTDGSPFGFVNYNYTDRYMSERTEPSGSTLKINLDGEVLSATEFNNAVIQIYTKNSLNDSSISTATNYYIDKLTKNKAKDLATRASAMIPVSLNFTTDGVGGFYMGQAFTVDKDLLPYTYSAKAPIGQNKNYDDKVGFVVTGLSHTIEGNVWKTAVKTNMIFLKNVEDYQKNKYEQPPEPTQPVPAGPFTGPTPVADGLIARMQALTTSSGNRLFIKDKANSITYGGDIKQNLADAAYYIMEQVIKKFPLIELRGISGISRYHMNLPYRSAHKEGRGADISIINTNKYYVPWKDGTNQIDTNHPNYANYMEVHRFLRTLVGDFSPPTMPSRLILGPESVLVKQFKLSLFLDEVIQGSPAGTDPHWHIQTAS